MPLNKSALRTMSMRTSSHCVCEGALGAALCSISRMLADERPYETGDISRDLT